MQFGKWTVEGAVKPLCGSILQRSASVMGEECVGTLPKCAELSANQGGTAGLYFTPVLVNLRGRAFLFKAASFPTNIFWRLKMLNLSLEEVKAFAGEYTAVPVVEECMADMVTPLGFLSTVKRSSSDYFLLESLEHDESWSRYSFIGFDPVLKLRCKDYGVEIVSGSAAVKFTSTDPVEKIREILAEYKVPVMKDLPPFTGGFVGYFAYDFYQYCEPAIRFDESKATDFADFDLMLFDKLIAFDRLKQKIYIIINVKTDNAEVNYAKAQREIAAVKAMLEQEMLPVPLNKAVLGKIKSNQSREFYNKSIEKCKDYIKKGDAFQIVYSQRFTAEYSDDLFNAYRLLRISNPSQYMVLMKNGDIEIAGSSPETLVKVTGRRVTAMPIAGTRPRGITEEEDKRLERELLADEKEIAEHNMLVDLGRNDLGRVCEFGSVRVLDYKMIKRFSHVMHITTRVTGELKKGLGCLDALKAVFPAGTLSGAPKIRACQIIDELEPQRRGIYGGGMGYIDFGGNMDICITIRTMVKKGGMVYVQAGGGIVADSVSDNEFMETVNKAGACLKALQETAKEQ